VSYEVVDLVKYYNFGIMFVIIEYHMRKLWSCGLSLPVIRFSTLNYFKVLTKKINYIWNKKIIIIYITNNSEKDLYQYFFSSIPIISLYTFNIYVTAIFLKKELHKYFLHYPIISRYIQHIFIRLLLTYRRFLIKKGHLFHINETVLCFFLER
jgi:hypothetical protein